VNGRSPFVGPRPFEKEDRESFFGRTRELEELLSLLIAHRAVLVYAQSGAGKTSLLKAGVIPRLEEQDFRVLPPARVHGVVPQDVRPEDVLNIFVFHALQYWSPLLQDGRKPADYIATTFTDFFRALLPPPKNPETDDEPGAPCVIVFDQFEEFFTVNADRWQQRPAFFQQLADALNVFPTLRVVFVMREEYTAQIEAFAELMPEKLRTRMHLQRLRGDSARSAVVKPFEKFGLSFAEIAAQRLLEELSEIRVAEGDQFRVARGEYVEPVQLQVVCQSLWENLREDWKNGAKSQDGSPRVITEEFVGNFGDVNNALARYYDRSVKNASDEGKMGEGELRRWIGTALITPTGTRGLAFRGAPGAAGRIPGLALKQLEDAHVIRREDRAGTITHELTHDRFIEPIEESNRAWLSRFDEAEKIRARLEKQAQEHTASGALLDEVALREAEAFLASPEAQTLGVSRAAQDLVRRSRKELEADKQRQLDELKEAKQRAAEERRLHQLETERVLLLTQKRKRDKLFAFLVVVLGAFTVLTVFLLSYGKVQRLRAERRANAEKGADYRSKAAEKSTEPIADITALRNLAIALTLNPNDGEAARAASRLLLNETWCPPLARDLRVQESAILAATFAPAGPTRQMFVVTGDGKLQRWWGEEAASATLFPKLTPAADQIEQPGFASFSPDGQWLAVIPPVLASGTVGGDPSQSAEQGFYSPKGSSGTESRSLQLWQRSANNLYEVVTPGLTFERFTSARTNLAWSPDSRRLILTTSRGNESQCKVLHISRDGVNENPEQSQILTSLKVATVAFDESGSTLAVVSVDRVIRLLQAATLDVIPAALGGQNTISFTDAFQATSLAFGPKPTELTLMSWAGMRSLALPTGVLITHKPPTFRDTFMRLTVGPVTPAGRLAATSLYGRIKVSAESGATAEPVVIRGALSFPQFSADGNAMLILSGGSASSLDTMRIVDVSQLQRPAQPREPPKAQDSVPAWLGDLSAAVSALDPGSDGSLRTLEMVRAKHAAPRPGDPYEPVWKRFFPD
jgi:hypothetical protein